MAFAYWKSGKETDEAVFHLFFRNAPFGGGYAIAAGLEDAIRYLETLRFEPDDLGYLASLRGNDGAPLFPADFLEHLKDFRFTCDVDAVPEGTVVFAQEPLLRVRGPILQGQVVETALLNVVNFQTLIATKAARVVYAAKGDAVADFGLRRAQGPDGGLSAARAAYIGGIESTSNVLAGARYGMPVKGTHAHSWVMSFDSELESFEAYAAALPNNALLLVDTYDTLQGVRNAIAVAARLRQRGHELIGIRLDSGDLAWLSIEARRMLDEAGFAGAVIAASNDLDEHLITSLKDQGAQDQSLGCRYASRDRIRPAGARRRLQTRRDPTCRRGVGAQGQGVGAGVEDDDARHPQRAAFQRAGRGSRRHDLRRAPADRRRSDD